MGDLRNRFSEIYETNGWESQVSKSGIGSEPRNAKYYVEKVEKFILKNNIHTVVDFGCGDMRVASLINLSGAKYLGIDIVEAVSSHNRIRYPNHTFKVGNMVDIDVEEADLMLCKDVLQHLPNQTIIAFIEKQLHKFRFSILTNDVDHYHINKFGFRQDRIGKINTDITAGDWRPVDLTTEPFSLECSSLGKYKVRQGNRIWIKEILLYL